MGGCLRWGQGTGQRCSHIMKRHQCAHALPARFMCVDNATLNPNPLACLQAGPTRFQKEAKGERRGGGIARRPGCPKKMKAPYI